MSVSLLSEGVSVLLEDGPVEFVERTRRFLLERAYYVVWRVKGEKSMRANGYSVRIHVSNFGDCNELVFAEANELPQIEDMLTELTEGDTLLDVGANVGIHSLFADQVAAHVYAIEPHPGNNSQLLINKEKNAAGIDVYQCAFSDAEQYLPLSGPGDGKRTDGRATFSDLRDEPSIGSNEIFVRAERGDTFVANEASSAITAIKIDVEGAEGRVIEGLTGTLSAEDCRLVYCEVHEDRASYEAITSVLESLGYSIEVVDERERGRSIKAKK